MESRKYFLINFGRMNWLPSLLLTIASVVSITQNLVEIKLNPFNGSLIIEPSYLHWTLAILSFFCAWGICTGLFILEMKEGSIISMFSIIVLTLGFSFIASSVISTQIAINLLTPL